MSGDVMTAALVAVAAYFVLRMFFAMRGRISGADARAKVEEGALLLDVRSEMEFGSGALPGAKNIPVQSLGARLSELEKSRPVVVYCASGMRSARAKSLLASSGFEVFDLGPKSAW